MKASSPALAQIDFCSVASGKLDRDNLKRDCKQTGKCAICQFEKVFFHSSIGHMQLTRLVQIGLIIGLI
jgi:hypothetical protein